MEKLSYPQFHEKISAFYRSRKKAAKTLFWTDKTATALVFLAYVTGFFLLIFQKNALFSAVFWKFLSFPFVSLVFVALLRIICKRKRPYENGVKPLFEKGKTGGSFPSRHAASAFSIGVSLIPVCHLLGILALFCGFVFFYTRTVLGWHYPTDLIAGGVLGGVIGALSLI